MTRLLRLEHTLAEAMPGSNLAAYVTEILQNGVED